MADKEVTKIVDVIAVSDGYKLDEIAENIYIAPEVVRRHVDSDGVRHYSQLVKSELTDNGFSFTFDTGDVFTAAGADVRPAAASVSDAPIAQTIVTFTNDGTQWSADKTFDEILALLESGAAVVGKYVNNRNWAQILTPVGYAGDNIWFVYTAISVDDDEAYVRDIKWLSDDSIVASDELVYNLSTLRG